MIIDQINKRFGRCDIIMKITIHCEACQSAYTVDEEAVGPRAKCGKCGHIFVVPWRPPPGDDPFQFAPNDPTVQPPPAPEPKWKLPTVFIIDAPAEEMSMETPSARLGLRVGPNPEPSFIDTIASYTLFVFVAASVTLGVYDTVKIVAQMDSIHSPWSVIGNLWGWIVCANILLFVAGGPMLWLGVWVASKIINFKMIDSAYLRACAAAALATALLILGAITQGPLHVLYYLAIVPALFFILKLFFSLDWMDGAIGFVMGAIAWIASVFAGNLLLCRIISQEAVAQVQNSFTAGDGTQIAAATSPSPPTNSTAAGAAVASSPPQSDLTLLRFSNDANRIIHADYSGATREQVAPSAADLRRRLEGLRVKYHDDPQFEALARDIDDFDKKIAAMPSGAIDPSLYQNPAVADAEDWTTGNLSRSKLAPEVSIGRYKFQPPLEMKVAPAAPQPNGEGVRYTAPSAPPTELSISIFPRHDPKQRRPLISTQPADLRNAQEKGLLAMDSSRATVSNGQINGIAFTRIASNPDVPGNRSVQYIAATDDGNWLILRLTLPSEKSLLSKIVDASARTVRQADASDGAAADPLPATRPAPER